MKVKHDDSFEEFNTKANRFYLDYFGDFRIVGDGKVTSRFCGAYRSVDGCIRIHLHEGKMWKGKDATGKVYVRRINMSCKKSSCPLCFKHGWGLRQAGNVANRLEGISKKHGLDVEHLFISVPKSDYEFGVKDYKALRAKAVRILKARGIVGGCMIFHAYRFHDVKPKGWYGSPHFHVLGFVDGNYKCRACKRKNNCLKGCGGFDDVSYQQFLKDGYYAKVMGKRGKSYVTGKSNVFGTAIYQLNHSSYKLGVNRFHICTYFGICGHRVFKSLPFVKDKKACPICEYDVEKLVYLGGMLYYERWRREKGSPDKSNEFLLSYMEDGRIAWGLDDRKDFVRRKRGVK